MKQLTIVRHAKSAWDNFELSDHDRPIKSTGFKKTNRIIDFLKSKNFSPDVILSSSAVRAYETAVLIANGIGFDKGLIKKTKSLYHAGVDDIYNEVFGINNDVNTVMLVAHNPTLTDFVNEFVQPNIDNLPTTGTVCIEFKTENWEKIADAEYNVKFVVFPRMLT
jgi:phosphohistidine phosphatase